MTGPAFPSDVHRLPPVGPYALLRELGRGSFGAVYAAQRPGQAPVALKLLLDADQATEEDLRRFWLEGTVVRKLDDPGVIPVFDLGRAGRHVYFTMELVEGGTLEDRLRSGPLSLREAAGLVASLGETLGRCHARGVVHRDVKPGNVLLDRARGPRLGDFGLARDRALVDGLTRSGVMLGTPLYMAPEQIEGAKHAGAPADVYALGCVLYECLTGHPPFGDFEHVNELLQRIVLEEPTPPSAAVAAAAPADSLCLRALAKRPEQRPSAAELARELRLLERPAAASAEAAGVGPARLIPWLSGAALLLAALASGALLGAGASSAPSPSPNPSRPQRALAELDAAALLVEWVERPERTGLAEVTETLLAQARPEGEAELAQLERLLRLLQQASGEQPHLAARLEARRALRQLSAAEPGARAAPLSRLRDLLRREPALSEELAAPLATQLARVRRGAATPAELRAAFALGEEVGSEAPAQARLRARAALEEPPQRWEFAPRERALREARERCERCALPRYRDRLDLARAQLRLAHGRFAQAAALAGGLLGSALVRRRAHLVLGWCQWLEGEGRRAHGSWSVAAEGSDRAAREAAACLAMLEVSRTPAQDPRRREAGRAYFQSLGRLLERDPNDPLALALRGDALLRLDGALRPALDPWGAALRRDPDLRALALIARALLGRAFPPADAAEASGLRARAVERFLQLSEGSDSALRRHLLLGVASDLIRAARYEAAHERLGALIQLEPINTNYRVLEAIALHGLGRRAEARREARLGLAYGHDPRPRALVEQLEARFRPAAAELLSLAQRWEGVTLSLPADQRLPLIKALDASASACSAPLVAELVAAARPQGADDRLGAVIRARLLIGRGHYASARAELAACRAAGAAPHEVRALELELDLLSGAEGAQAAARAFAQDLGAPTMARRLIQGEAALLLGELSTCRAAAADILEHVSPDHPRALLLRAAASVARDPQQAYRDAARVRALQGDIEVRALEVQLRAYLASLRRGTRIDLELTPFAAFAELCADASAARSLFAELCALLGERARDLGPGRARAEAELARWLRDHEARRPWCALLAGRLRLSSRDAAGARAAWERFRRKGGRLSASDLQGLAELDPAAAAELKD